MTQKLNEQVSYLKGEIRKRDNLLDDSELAELDFDVAFDEECDLNVSIDDMPSLIDKKKESNES